MRMLEKNSYITNQIQEERQVSFMCHRIFPQMSHITKKLYWAKKTNVKNDVFILFTATFSRNEQKTVTSPIKFKKSAKLALCVI